jgi:tetratricopeptide (TPR) repeat protein
VVVAVLAVALVAAAFGASATAQVGSIERGGSFEKPYVPPRKRLVTRAVSKTTRPTTRPTRPTPTRPTPTPEAPAEVEISSDAIAHYEAGRAAYDRNQYEKAIDEFEKAIREDSKYLDALIDLGDVYFDRANLDDAVESYRRALAIDRSNVDAQYRLGRAAFAMRDYDTAVTAFNAVMKANAADAQAVYNLGLTYKALKRFDDAIPVFQKAIEMRTGSSYPEARLNLARSLYEVGRIDESETEARKAIEEIGPNDPDSANAWYALATVQAKKSDLEGAIASIQHAIDVCKECSNSVVSPFYEPLARLYEARGEKVKAAEAYERFLQVAPYLAPYRIEEIRAKVASLRGGGSN